MPGQWFDQFLFMVLENTGWDQMQSCKFVDYFSKNGAICTNWHGVAHPSGPNYRAMLSGQTWSGNEFDGVNRENVSKHIDYLIYKFRGDAAQRHNPFLDMNPDDPRLALPSGIFDGSNLATITYLGMDDGNNAHSGPLDLADQNTMNAIAIYDRIKNDRLLFMVTTDEGFGSNYESNHVFTGFLGAGVKPGSDIIPAMSHYNLARFLADNWSINLPPEADPKASLFKGQSILEIA